MAAAGQECPAEMPEEPRKAAPCPLPCRFQHNEALRVLLGVIVGLVVGLVLSLAANLSSESETIQILAFPGKLWLKALKCVVLPMIFCGMVHSMVMMRELPAARSAAIWVIGLYTTTTVVAAAEGVAVSWTLLRTTLKPVDAAPVQDTGLEKMSMLDTVLNIFDQLVPKNVVNDAAKNHLISVILMAIVAGCLLRVTRANGKRSILLELLDEINEVVTKVINGLIWLSPLGVGSLVCSSAARFDLAHLGTSVALLVAAVLCAAGVHMFVFSSLLLMLGAGRNPIRYFANCLPALLTALGSSSSAAALPLNIQIATDKNNLSPHIAKFVLNLGATINMDGTTAYLICATSFLAALQGITLGVGDYASMVLMATLCSMGSAPVPSGSLVLLTTLLTTLNIPVTETFGLITAVDWLLDRVRTCVNVYGDACVAAVVDKKMEGCNPKQVPARPTLGEEAPFSPSPYPFPATGLPVTESPPPPRPREAPAPYTFPTAGSFVAEPFHESQMAYPSASRDRWSEEPVPGSVPRDPMLDRYAPPPSRQTPDALTGDWYRDGHRSYHTGLGASPSSPSLGTYGSSFAGSNGTSRNGYACANGYANGNGYSYSGLLNKGDTYSGGTVSYGPPPTRCGAYSSGCGGCGSAGMNPLGFPSIGSFVAEPFAPGAPTLSSSRVPPPLPSPLPSFSGPSLLGGSFNFGGFSLPPPTGSFVADPAAYATASHSGGQSPTAATAEAPLGVSAPAPEKAASPAPGKAEGRAETLPAPKAPPRAMAKEKSKKRKPARGACC
ncbi:SLC1A5 [Symbiodinium natans]|uniref:Amino acid transporter n=1 Tax=Symbiodinium natans TaxID=878477 RepID=A0A812I9Z8_9DINO|nr:SLC1A5 [Symbiodinium natans]